MRTEQEIRLKIDVVGQQSARAVKAAAEAENATGPDADRAQELLEQLMLQAGWWAALRWVLGEEVANV